MYNVNDFIEMLENGRAVEDIADELTKNLNEAKAEVEKREALQKEAKRQVARRNELLTEIYNLLTTYLLEFYPEVEISKEERIPTEEELTQLAEQLDNLVQMYKTMAKIQEEIREEPIWDEFMKLFRA